MKYIKYIIFSAILLFTTCTNGKSDNQLINNSSQNTDENKEEIQALEGYWIFEKSNIYGGYEEGKEYDITHIQLDSTFNMFIEITSNIVELGNGYISFYELEKVELQDFFYGKVDTTETLINIKSFFKKEFNVEMKDSLFIYKMGNEYPFNRMIVFENKILMFEYGCYFACFTKGNKPKGTVNTVCKESSGGMESIEKCTYNEKNMQQVYNIIKVKYPQLKHELPQSNLEYDTHIDRTNVKVIYCYKNKRHLTISLFYGGGIDELELIEMGNNIISLVTRSAD